VIFHRPAGGFLLALLGSVGVLLVLRGSRGRDL
jgi:hypothetical protein